MNSIRKPKEFEIQTSCFNIDSIEPDSDAFISKFASASTMLATNRTHKTMVGQSLISIFLILTENEEFSQILDISSQTKHIPTASLINIPIIQKIMNSRVTLKNYFGKKHEDDRNTDFVEVNKSSAYIYISPI